MSRSGCGAVSMTISQGKCCGTVSTTIFTSSVASWTRVKDSAMRPYGKSSFSHYKLLAALAGYAHSSLEPGHHRSAVKEGRSGWQRSKTERGNGGFPKQSCGCLIWTRRSQRL